MEFPSLYHIALVSSAMVKDIFNTHNRSLSWNIVFGNGLQHKKLDDYALLLTFLYEVHIRVGDGDCSRWRLAQNSIFSVGTYFKSL